MQEVFGDCFRFRPEGYDEVCLVVPTNGTIKEDGRLVMGAGVAKQVREKTSNLDFMWGQDVKRNGNVPIFSELSGLFGRVHKMMSFPTKNDWRGKSDIELIKRSALFLNEKAKEHSSVAFVLPRPGCGNGGLKWDDVRPTLIDLPDNVFVIDKE